MAIMTEKLRPPLRWGTIDAYGGIERTRIPGGWLVRFWTSASSGTAGGLTFVPDPTHAWDGRSLG